MKHRIAKRTLGRTANHRRALLRNLSSELLRHGSLVTTAPKARELRRYLEPLITEARRELSLARRRYLLSRLSASDDLDQLLEVAKAHRERPGGYLRLTRLPRTRHDAAEEMRVDILEGQSQPPQDDTAAAKA